jgi:hypothetical protein
MRVGLSRQSPLTASEDPTVSMIRRVRRHAESKGMQLTEDEERVLAGESMDVPESIRLRLKELVTQIIESERYDETSVNDPKSFINSIKWAGNREYPIVVQLAEEVFCENPGPGEPKGSWLLDKSLLVIVGIAVVMMMLAVVLLLSFLFHW